MAEVRHVIRLPQKTLSAIPRHDVFPDGASGMWLVSYHISSCPPPPLRRLRGSTTNHCHPQGKDGCSVAEHLLWLKRQLMKQINDGCEDILLDIVWENMLSGQSQSRVKSAFNKYSHERLYLLKADLTFIIVPLLWLFRWTHEMFIHC